MTEYDTGLSPGRIVGGKYFILHQIGDGGSGKVYQVKDLHLSKIWAMKWISTKKRHQELTFQELERMRNLNHPRLPRIVDAFALDCGVCIVMDLLEGKTLDRLLAEGTAGIEEQDCINWGIQLCEALDYLHHCSPPMIYRDMKPGNVLVRPDKTVMLLDFGAGEQEGTPGYASPEQREGKTPDVRSDIYGLGRTLYKARNKITNPRNRKFLSVLKKACETLPENRFQSAAQMRDALKKAASGSHPDFQAVSKAGKMAVISAVIGAAAVCAVITAASFAGERSASAAVPANPEKKAAVSDAESEERIKNQGEADRYVELANRYLKENPQQALFCLKEACRLREEIGERDESYDLMLRILRILLSESAGNLPDHEREAQEYFQRLCAAEPDRWEPYLIFISYEYRSGRLREAAELFQRASAIDGIKNDPNYRSLQVKLENAGALPAG